MPFKFHLTRLEDEEFVKIDKDEWRHFSLDLKTWVKEKYWYLKNSWWKWNPRFLICLIIILTESSRRNTRCSSKIRRRTKGNCWIGRITSG